MNTVPLDMSDSESNLKRNEETRLPSVMSGSVEDLSEYTDADESVSAPTEILAEEQQYVSKIQKHKVSTSHQRTKFLSAVMLKDYETALKYCKLILQYEPNNSTAKEFYPLITEKIEMETMPWDIPRAVDGHWIEICRKLERLPDPIPVLHHDPPMTYYNNVKIYRSFVPYDLFYNFEEGYDPRSAREDRSNIQPMFENIFKEEEKKLIPITSQLCYGRPRLLENVLDWSVRFSRTNAIKDFYRSQEINITPELEQTPAH